ncbi:MAG: hypothetical protein JW892_00575 [Anaerolineae bacterium]|nr:hypothetical protein [Anaerolineae bacterium]
MRFARSSLPTLRLHLDSLWLLIVLVGLALYVSLIRQPPHDFWWHLKIGELIAATHRIPTTNIFAWTLPAETPFVYGAWLGQWLLYGFYRWGGVSLLLFTRTALFTAALALVGCEARRLSGSWRLAALAVAFAGGMALNNLIVRPQMWSWLPFVLMTLLLRRYVAGVLQGRWLLLCPLLMVFWVNAHGAFVLGLVLQGAFFAGELLRALWRDAGALPWIKLRWLGVILLLSLLATSINPQFVGIYRYVVGLMMDQPSQSLVIEWQSPTPQGIPNTVFFVSILALFLALLYARYRLTLTEVFLTVGFLWLAWSGQRYVVWFGLLTMPLLATAGAQLLPRRWIVGSLPPNALNAALAVFLCLPLLLALPWVAENLPLSEEYWKGAWREVEQGPLLSRENPLAAVDYLRAHPGGRLFHEMGYGSYLIWALPEQGVFVDPRVELYPHDLWLDYVRIGKGVRSIELLEHYGANRVLLNVKLQEELLLALERAPDWRREYADAETQIWSRVQAP